jgi:hypothetical protein
LLNVMMLWMLLGGLAMGVVVLMGEPAPPEVLRGRGGIRRGGKGRPAGFHGPPLDPGGSRLPSPAWLFR